MRVVGLVVEYNPFHNGHLYHLQQSKAVTEADFVVCVMSGNFIQRGEPAIVNKWARAKMALLSGVDVVIELPTVYAMSSAEYFAYGAVKILDSLGIVDYLCFGSEHGSIEALNMIADVLINEPELYKASLKLHLDKGLSFPAARQAALRHYFQENLQSNADTSSILNSSNNILGVEYLKAIKKLKSSIIPTTIKRISNSYNTEEMTGSISSATAIRKHISKIEESNTGNVVKQAMPDAALEVLNNEFNCGRGPISPHLYEDILLTKLRFMNVDQIKELPYVSEGLENRIKIAAYNSGSLEELIENISTKRYTRTRIQRTLFCALLGITSADIEAFEKYGGPQYARVLGFSENGKSLLSQIKKKATLPLIVKASDYKYSCNTLLRKMLALEASSTDVYVLGYKNSLYKKGGQEYTSNIVFPPKLYID